MSPNISASMMLRGGKDGLVAGVGLRLVVGNEREHLSEVLVLGETRLRLVELLRVVSDICFSGSA